MSRRSKRFWGWGAIKTALDVVLFLLGHGSWDTESSSNRARWYRTTNRRSKEPEPWGRFAIKAALVAVLAGGSIVYVSDRYRVGKDSQEVRCLPDHSFFLVDRWRTEPVRDQLMAFSAQGLEPYFTDGTTMAKRLVGMPGDELRVDEAGVWINGDLKAEGFPHKEKLGLVMSDLERAEVIPDDHFLFLAPAPESYDGRYWGYVQRSQLLGSVRPLF